MPTTGTSFSSLFDTVRSAAAALTENAHIPTKGSNLNGAAKLFLSRMLSSYKVDELFIAGEKLKKKTLEITLQIVLDHSEIVKGVLVGSGVGIAAPVVLTTAVHAVGFTTAGIAGKSVAAWMMKTWGTKFVIVPLAQSIGATGALSVSSQAFLGTIFGAVTVHFGEGTTDLPTPFADYNSTCPC